MSNSFHNEKRSDAIGDNTEKNLEVSNNGLKEYENIQICDVSEDDRSKFQKPRFWKNLFKVPSSWFWGGVVTITFSLLILHLSQCGTLVVEFNPPRFELRKSICIVPDVLEEDDK